jgi:hypothetical protein
MKTGLIILVFIIGLSSTLPAQSLVGLGKEEVKVVMLQKKKNFRIDKTIVRQQFNYLKYVNNLHTKTFIILFSKDDICTKTKMVCDYSEYDKLVEKLNETYEVVNDTAWKYNFEEMNYLISLEKLEWYFVLRETEEVN